MPKTVEEPVNEINPALESPARIQFWKAMAFARSKFKTVVKNKTNPHFHYRYADLSCIKEAVDPALEEAGFIYWHELGSVSDGGYGVMTHLLHLLTNHEETSFFKLPDLQDPQKMGSAITYGRRYTLSALLGIVSEDDDDGEAGKDSLPQPLLHRKAKDEPPSPADTGLTAMVLIKDVTVSSLPGWIFLETDQGRFTADKTYHETADKARTSKKKAQIRWEVQANGARVIKFLKITEASK